MYHFFKAQCLTQIKKKKKKQSSKSSKLPPYLQHFLSAYQVRTKIVSWVFPNDNELTFL